MRNPLRICKVVDRLEEVWAQYPDLRLGQLILNLQRDYNIYNMEDEELIEKIEKFYLTKPETVVTSPMDKKITIARLSGENQNFPAGSYIAVDPCYVFPEDKWDDFCEALSGDNDTIADDGAIMEYDGYKFFVMQTAYGDGCYPLKCFGTTVAELGVDAGLLSLIPLEAAHEWHKSPNKLPKLGQEVQITEDFTVKTLGRGNWAFDDYSVYTDYDETEEEDEWDDYEESEEGEE